MKKRLICVAIMVAAVGHAATASAQVGGGVKVGVNWASVSGSVAVDDGVRADKSFRTGLLVGGFLTFNFIPLLSFEPEVLYSEQGVKLTQGGQEAKAEFNYVQVPLLLRIGGSGKSAAGLYGLVGPAFGHVSSPKLKVSGQPDQDLKNDIKSNDTSIVFGVGITLSRFLVEGRYSEGLTDINEGSDGSNKNRNRVFAAIVGLHF
jgi:outer membrane protein with beta-barrel domain